MLARACARSRCYEPIDVLRLVFAREWMVWTVWVGHELVAVIVCRATQYPRRKILEMQYAAGSRMREWVGAAQTHFDEVARRMGCDAVTTVGRRGWARAGAGVVSDVICVRELES